MSKHSSLPVALGLSILFFAAPSVAQETPPSGAPDQVQTAPTQANDDLMKDESAPGAQNPETGIAEQPETPGAVNRDAESVASEPLAEPEAPTTAPQDFHGMDDDPL